VDTGGSFPGIKRPELEAEVKNEWIYTSIPPYTFIAWCLVKYRTHLHGVVLG